MKIKLLMLFTFIIFSTAHAEDRFDCPKEMTQIRDFDLMEQNYMGKKLKLFTATNQIVGASFFVLDSKNHFIKLHYKNAPLKRSLYLKSGQMLTIKDIERTESKVKIEVESRYFDKIIIEDNRDANSDSMNQFFVMCEKR